MAMRIGSRVLHVSTGGGGGGGGIFGQWASPGSPPFV